MSCRRSRPSGGSCSGPALGWMPGRHGPFFRWAAAAGMAAAVVLAVAVVLWMRPQPPSERPKRQNRSRQSKRQLPEKPRAPRRSGAADLRHEPSLEQLARVEPPRYEPLTLRGAPDEATARFQRGMERYRKADYRGAIADLRAAAELDPDAAHIRFFLGISHLMLGEDDAAIDGFRRRSRSATLPISKTRTCTWRRLFCGGRDLGAAETQLKRRRPASWVPER